jgi:hypothetical protein
LYIVGQFNVLSAVAAIEFMVSKPFVEWIGSASWLFLPATACAFSCAYLLLHALEKIHHDLRRERLLFTCCLAVLTASFIFIALEAAHFNVLRDFYRANALLPLSYLTIGGALAVSLKHAGQLRQLGLSMGFAVILLVPWVLTTLGYIFPQPFF